MDYEEFITVIERTAGLPREGAERAARATLTQLGCRLPEDLFLALEEELPGRMAGWLRAEGTDEAFSAQSCIGHVGEQCGVDRDKSTLAVQGVFFALRRSLLPETYAALEAALHEDFRPLVAEPSPESQPLRSAQDWWQRVAEFSGRDVDDARRGTAAVLQTLGERISSTEVDTLARLLPPELRASLERGREMCGGKPRKMIAGEFTERVARNEGVPPEDAREQVSAVLATLRHALSEREFEDVLGGLPREDVRQLETP